MSIHDFTANFFIVFLLMVWGVGIFRYKNLNFPFKILTWSALSASLIALLSKIWIIRYRNNIPIAHLEAITEYVFYSLTYYYLFKNEKIKKVIGASIVIFIVFFFINALVLQPYHNTPPTNVFFPSEVLFVIFSLLLAKEMLASPTVTSPLKQSRFWYIFGLIFYSVTLFLIIADLYYFHAYDPYIYYLWYFILYVFHLLIGISLLFDNKKIAITND